MNKYQQHSKFHPNQSKLKKFQMCLVKVPFLLPNDPKSRSRSFVLSCDSINLTQRQYQGAQPESFQCHNKFLPDQLKSEQENEAITSCSVNLVNPIQGQGNEKKW